MIDIRLAMHAYGKFNFLRIYNYYDQYAAEYVHHIIGILHVCICYDYYINVHDMSVMVQNCRVILESYVAS